MARARPSRTAVKIARFLVLLDADPRRRAVLPAGSADATERVLRDSGAVLAWQVDMMRAGWIRRFAGAAERLTGRGQVLWFGLRKRWIADRVDDLLGAGARQVLVLGAGFDVLAARVAASDPHVLAVETDEAATADPKRVGLEVAGLLAPNVTVVSASLDEQRLAEVLSPTPWQRDVVSVVVAEGLLMYLTPSAVAAFFADLHECVGPGSTLLCTSVFDRGGGRPRVASRLLDRPIRLALRLAGEPMHLGLDPADAPAFFDRHGATVAAQPTVADLRAGYLEPHGLADEPVTAYEHLVEARIGAD